MQYAVLGGQPRFRGVLELLSHWVLICCSLDVVKCPTFGLA